MNTITPQQALAFLQEGKTPWVAYDKTTGLPVGFFRGRQAARDFASGHNAKIDKADGEAIEKANGDAPVEVVGPVEVAVIERRGQSEPPAPIDMGAAEVVAPLPLPAPAPEPKHEGIPFYDQWKANGVCPHCGDDPSSITAAGREGTILGDNFDFCHHCSTTFNRVSGKIHNGDMTGHVRSTPDSAIPRINKSTIDRPTKTVWYIADDMKGAKRKDVLKACTDRGIAYYTARTQYQQWLTTQKEEREREAATAAMEAAKKAKR